MQCKKMASPGLRFTLVWLEENKPRCRYWLVEIQLGRYLWSNKKKA